MEKTKITTIGEYLGELMRLAHEVNMQTEYCVFINYSGHVDDISYRVCKSKKKFTEYIHSENWHYVPKDYADDDGKIAKKFEKEISYLKYLIDDSKK